MAFSITRWFIEQHCLTRGRFARALVAMHSQGLKFGIGVDENTACVVRNGSEVEIVGYQGRRGARPLQRQPRSRRAGFNLKNVRMTYLDHGDTFDLHTLEVTPAKEKQAGGVAMPQGTELDNDPSRTRHVPGHPRQHNGRSTCLSG